MKEIVLTRLFYLFNIGFVSNRNRRVKRYDQCRQKKKDPGNSGEGNACFDHGPSDQLRRDRRDHQI